MRRREESRQPEHGTAHHLLPLPSCPQPQSTHRMPCLQIELAHIPAIQPPSSMLMRGSSPSLLHS